MEEEEEEDDEEEEEEAEGLGFDEMFGRRRLPARLVPRPRVRG